MTWPTSDIDTTHADAGTDVPSVWRAAALALSQAFNQVRNHVSTYMQNVLEAANAGAARTALGFTTVGSNVGTAADEAAARTAIGAVGTTGAQTVAGLKTFSGGHLSTSSTQPIGYGTGAGAFVFQTTSKTTLVTINRPCGIIFTHDASLAAGATVVFTVACSLLGANDVVVISRSGVANLYDVYLDGSDVGEFSIRILNRGVTRAEMIGIKFAIVKGVQA